MISLFMIVKNEASSLARCLNSVKAGVDEMIIVDTGSTDNTVAIATSFGAKVAYYTWNDDFAAARNFSLEQASGDWLLYLDADEELEPGGAARLRQLSEATEAEAFTFHINNLTDGNNLVRHINVRLFRNRPEYRFEGRLHEQIATSIVSHNPGKTVIHNSGLTLIHYGYLSNEFAAKNKAERNLRLNCKMLEEEPDNPFYLYTLGNSYMNSNDVPKALDCYQRSIDHLNPNSIYAPSVFVSCISCLVRLGHWRRAQALLEQGKSLYPDYVDLHFIEGEIAKELGNLPKAQECFERCAAMGERSQKYTTRSGVGSFLPLFALAELAKAKGDLDTAVALHLQALKLAPPQLQRYIEFVSLLRSLHRSNDQLIEELWQAVAEPDPIAKGLTIAQILYSANEFSLALAVLTPLKGAGDGLRGLALMGLGRFEDARVALSSALERTPGDPAVVVEAILCHWLSQPRLNAATLIDQLPDGAAKHTYRRINSCMVNKQTCRGGVDQGTLLEIIDRLLTLKQPDMVLEVLKRAGYSSAAHQIGLLLGQPYNADRLELVAKLALQELKGKHPEPAYFLVLSKYFLSHHELALAEKMISQALAVSPNHPVYGQILCEIYRQMQHDILQTARVNYPENQQLAERLLEFKEAVAAPAMLKGVH